MHCAVGAVAVCACMDVHARHVNVAAAAQGAACKHGISPAVQLPMLPQFTRWPHALHGTVAWPTACKHATHHTYKHVLPLPAVEQQLAVVQQADVLIGVHGTALAFSLALPPHAALVEIWPQASKQRLTCASAGRLAAFLVGIDS